MEMNLAEIFQESPLFAKGIWVLMLSMSFWSLTVAVGKWNAMRKAAAETKKFAPEFDQFLTEDKLSDAIDLADQYKKSHVAKVLGSALGEVKPLLLDGTVTVSDINSVERAVEREMLQEIVEMKRGLAVIATVGSTAPFVGLLGTVVGIINAFSKMGASGSSGINEIIVPIAEALIATGLGLGVAIPAVWFYNYFQTKIENLTAEMTHSSKYVIDYLIRGMSGEFGRSRFTREFSTKATGGSAPIAQ